LNKMLEEELLDRDLLIATVGRHVPALHQGQVIYTIDCRRFLARALPYEEGMHTGCHPALFNRVVRHGSFPAVLLSIRSLLEDDKEMQRSSVSLMLCDAAGRHGSMSIAKALAECIASDPSLALGTVHILADQHSEAYCGVCARCEFWTRRWNSRNMAVKDVKELWFGPPE
jgi:hypothetical protein